MKTVYIIGIVGAVGLAAYFVINATSKSTDVSSTACAGDWTDYINPACWLGQANSDVQDAANAATNEINTILIIVALVVVAVVGLLAFGSSTGDIAKGLAFL